MGKAYGQFLYLIQQELEAEGYKNQEIESYTNSLTKFIRDKNIKQWLGKAFDPNCEKLEQNLLQTKWDELGFKALPEDFDWKRISKLYLKRVNDIIGESQEFKDLFSAKKLQEIATNTQNISGIIPDYDLERYRESLQETYGYLKLSKLDVTYRSKAEQVNLGNIFIPQTVKEALPPSRYDLPKEVLEKLHQEEAIETNFFESDFEQYQQLFLGKPSKSVLDIVKDDKYHYMVFLGDPGSGKSTVLQYLALDWADNTTEKIPLLIELRDYAKDENDPQDFLDYFHQGKRKICELNKQQLHEQLNTGKAVVMFDGLDEIFSKDIYGRVIKEIHAFSNKYRNVSIIITSRLVGYNPDELSNAEFTHFTLEEFNNNQIREFIKRWHKLALPEESSQDRYDTQKRLQTAVKESPAIRQLAGNPLLLTMMAILNRYQELPRRRIDRYKQSTGMWRYEYNSSIC